MSKRSPDVRLMDAPMFLAGPLPAAAKQCEAVMAAHRHRFVPADRRHLVTAFFRAESLALFALREAAECLPDIYRIPLIEQAADEERHVDFFAEWLDTRPMVPRPRARARQIPQRLATLLVNEITGFLQFCTLKSLCGEPGRRDAIEGMARDELRHIGRLIRWMKTFEGERVMKPVSGSVDRFCRAMSERLRQFFPRAALSPLVDALILPHIRPIRTLFGFDEFGPEVDDGSARDPWYPLGDGGPFSLCPRSGDEHGSR